MSYKKEERNLQLWLERPLKQCDVLSKESSCPSARSLSCDITFLLLICLAPNPPWVWFPDLPGPIYFRDLLGASSGLPEGLGRSSRFRSPGPCWPLKESPGLKGPKTKAVFKWDAAHAIFCWEQMTSWLNSFFLGFSKALTSGWR